MRVHDISEEVADEPCEVVSLVESHGWLEEGPRHHMIAHQLTLRLRAHEMLEGMPLSADVAAYRVHPIGESASPPPATFALRQNVPNPFSTGTVIAFDLPRATDVKLEIFDAQGRLLRMFATYKAAGRHSITWDLHDARGSRVHAGVYTYRLRAGAYEARRKMVVVP